MVGGGGDYGRLVEVEMTVERSRQEKRVKVVKDRVNRWVNGKEEWKTGREKV